MGDELAVRLEKLAVKPGDVCLVIGDDASAVYDTMKRLSGIGKGWSEDVAAAYRAHGGVPIIAVIGDVTLETVDEAKMNAAGWIRKP
jgi:hypothetical protein